MDKNSNKSHSEKDQKFANELFDFLQEIVDCEGDLRLIEENTEITQNDTKK